MACTFQRAASAATWSPPGNHRADSKDERARIEKAGGRVIFDGYANHRVYAKSESLPALNLARCLGNLDHSESCGISCTPEVSLHCLNSHTALLLCSNGV